jgi:DNA (cytosine-5)-methyltransferase 1
MLRNGVPSIELFSGGGGLALGLEEAGFQHVALVERDFNACETISLNARSRNGVRVARLFQGDVRTVSYPDVAGADVSLVAGGPPCQPFSLGGKHRGQLDERDLFPEAVRAVRELSPEAFIFENVRGLLRPAFSSYLQYVLLQLTYPFLPRQERETTEEHLERLERMRTAGRSEESSYNVVYRMLNAADYGVPQNRFRVFIVGFRSDLGIEWSFPRQTHSRDALLWSQWVSGEYWAHHEIPSRYIPEPTPKTRKRVDRLRVDYALTGVPLQRWRTVRDALVGLPSPYESDDKPIFYNHEARHGARAYPGHTGSSLDEPAKTLKAGDHGVPGGENMVRLDDGSLRYFSIRESARLQTFPDSYRFAGSWTEAMRQIGNAVPVRLGQVVGLSVAEQMMLEREIDRLRLVKGA